MSKYSEWSEEKKERHRKYRRKYYLRNKEKLKEAANQWADNNKEKRKESQRKWRQENPEKHRGSLEQKMLSAARLRAKKNNLPFEITLEDIVIPEFCPVFPDLKLESSRNTVSNASPSLDKVIPNLGYVPGNVFVISHLANSLKSAGTAEQHDRIAQWIRSVSPY